MTLRRIIESLFAPLKAVSKLIDFLSGILPYPLSTFKQIKTILKSFMYVVMSVWRPCYHVINSCLELTDEIIKQVAITL